jgi:protein disulfide-isomerase
MRFLPVSLLTLYASLVIAAPQEKKKKASTDDGSDEPKPTVFNGVEVPVLPEINGEKFNATVKEGYWFVKHHS